MKIRKIDNEINAGIEKSPEDKNQDKFEETKKQER